MRYDTKVKFVHQAGGPVYDPSSGKMVAQNPVIMSRFCRIYDLSTERKLELYGRADVSAMTLYHQGPPLEAETVSFGGRDYTITSRRKVRGKASYSVKEAKLNGR